MAIDKNTKSMLDPYKGGENYGIGVDYTLNTNPLMPTNYVNATSANQRTSVTEDLLSKVTQTNACGQEGFPVGNGGVNLGKVYNGKAGD